MNRSESIRGMARSQLGGFELRSVRMPRHFLLGLLLMLALLAFEAFNFDTTRYALDNLLGDVRFAGIAWATILAVAFCAIDFAGLGRLFTQERGFDEPREVWYLTGAWLLGATMNAVMTWWAVSTVLLSHDLGNEVLGREQLLHIVPVFVAILVWLTRILFIGAVTIAGERLLHRDVSPPSASLKDNWSSRPTSGARQPNFATKSATAVTMQAGPSEQTSFAPTSAGPTSANVTGSGRRPPRPRTAGYRPAKQSTLQASRRSRQ